MRPNNIARWRFSCKCGTQTIVSSIILYKDGDIEFLGNCPECGACVTTLSSVTEILDAMGAIPDDNTDEAFLKSLHISEQHDGD